MNSALSSFGFDNSVKIASVLITSFKPVYSGFLFHKLLLRQDTCFLSLNGLPTDQRVKALTFFSNQRKKSPSIRDLSHLPQFLGLISFILFILSVLNLNPVYE